jgi:hypothetical protein
MRFILVVVLVIFQHNIANADQPLSSCVGATKLANHLIKFSKPVNILSNFNSDLRLSEALYLELRYGNNIPRTMIKIQNLLKKYDNPDALKGVYLAGLLRTDLQAALDILQNDENIFGEPQKLAIFYRNWYALLKRDLGKRFFHILRKNAESAPVKRSTDSGVDIGFFRFFLRETSLFSKFSETELDKIFNSKHPYGAGLYELYESQKKSSNHTNIYIDKNGLDSFIISHENHQMLFNLFYKSQELNAWYSQEGYSDLIAEIVDKFQNSDLQKQYDETLKQIYVILGEAKFTKIFDRNLPIDGYSSCKFCGDEKHSDMIFARSALKAYMLGDETELPSRPKELSQDFPWAKWIFAAKNIIANETRNEFQRMPLSKKDLPIYVELAVLGDRYGIARSALEMIRQQNSDSIENLDELIAYRLMLREDRHCQGYLYQQEYLPELPLFNKQYWYK